MKRATSTAKNAHVNSKRSVSSVERSQVHHSKGTGEESNDSRCAILKKATIRKARIKTVFPDLIYESAVHSRLAKVCAFVMNDDTMTITGAMRRFLFHFMCPHTHFMCHHPARGRAQRISRTREGLTTPPSSL